MINDSFTYGVSYQVSSLDNPYTHDGLRFVRQGRWEYGSPLFSGTTDSLYPEEYELYLSPACTKKISFINTLSWGLAGNSKNELDINFKVPPEPENLTQEELDHYGITKHTYPNGYYDFCNNNLTCYAS
jgi:hypothetical protein